MKKFFSIAMILGLSAVSAFADVSESTFTSGILSFTSTFLLEYKSWVLLGAWALVIWGLVQGTNAHQILMKKGEFQINFPILSCSAILLAAIQNYDALVGLINNIGS